MERVNLRCPCCKKRVIDSDAGVMSEIRVVSEDTDWKPDYLGKCKKCGAEIGIKKLNKDINT